MKDESKKVLKNIRMQGLVFAIICIAFSAMALLNLDHFNVIVSFILILGFATSFSIFNQANQIQKVEDGTVDVGLDAKQKWILLGAIIVGLIAFLIINNYINSLQ